MQSEASPPPARVLIADDHALVREGMRTMLAREPNLEVVGEARNGREALELCRSSPPPDLVLMDLRMPEMDGLTATRAIKGEFPTTSVLIVTTHENLDHLLEAIKAGAAGYVLKDATKQQLMSAVRRVLDGESPLNQELAMRLIQRLAFDEADQQARPLSESSNKKEQQQEPPPESPLERLTTRELETLRLLVQGKTNREVARELDLSPSKIKAHVGRLIAKLGVSDRTQAAVRAVELGLLSKQAEEQ